MHARSALASVSERAPPAMPPNQERASENERVASTKARAASAHLEGVAQRHDVRVRHPGQHVSLGLDVRAVVALADAVLSHDLATGGEGRGGDDEAGSPARCPRVRLVPRPSLLSEPPLPSDPRAAHLHGEDLARVALADLEHLAKSALPHDLEQLKVGGPQPPPRRRRGGGHPRLRVRHAPRHVALRIQHSLARRRVLGLQQQRRRPSRARLGRGSRRRQRRRAHQLRDGRSRRGCGSPRRRALTRVAAAFQWVHLPWRHSCLQVTRLLQRRDPDARCSCPIGTGARPAPAGNPAAPHLLLQIPPIPTAAQRRRHARWCWGCWARCRDQTRPQS